MSESRDDLNGSSSSFETAQLNLRERLARVEEAQKHVATKEDVQLMRTEVSQLGGEIKGLIKDVEKEVKALESWALLKIITVISLVGVLIAAIVGALTYLSK